DFVLAEALKDVEQVAHRSRQAVEAGDDNDVACLQLFQHPLKGVAVAVRAASLLAVDPLAAGFLQGCELCAQVLFGRADPGISDLHFMAPLVHQLVQQDKRPCFRCQARRACLSSCARGGERRRVACVGISSRRSVCSALASQRSLSLGHAGQGAMVRSSLPCSCSSTQRRSGFLAFRFCAVSFSRRRSTAVSATRAAPAWGLGSPGPWPPATPMARPPPPTFIRPPPKICRSEKSRGDSRKFCRHALPRSCPGTIPFSRRRSLWQG